MDEIDTFLRILSNTFEHFNILKSILVRKETK